jgi:PLD-like domain
MASVSASKGDLSVRAYRGDAKTLLAFDLTKNAARRLAGFTIQCQPPGQAPFFLLNMLQFKSPADHTQDETLPHNSTINAPIHKFRWLHVPGSAHQVNPVFGTYRYTITPRYFDAHASLQPLDPDLSVGLNVEVAPFTKKGLSLGFTRGFTQSQAFVRHFGKNAPIRPKDGGLQFDTSKVAGTNKDGDFTFEDEYQWLGFTARQRVLELLNEVVAKKSMTLDVFAYDLNEPTVVELLLRLAKQGRVRIILDNAPLHHRSTPKKPAKTAGKKKTGKKAKPKPPPPEDQFEKLFRGAAKKGADILRGKFGRFSHDKVFVVSDKGLPVKVLTGSTNLSVTGIYVNSNHVIVFDDPKVAALYSKVFDKSWEVEAKAPAFRKLDLATQPFSLSSKLTPPFDVTFSPHDETFAQTTLDNLVARVGKESKKGKTVGSVLFAVMEMGKKSSGPVFPALRTLHANQSIFSYGISDNPDGIALYRPGTKQGVLVTGKPASTKLPPPFNQVPGVGIGHQVHHKFVVCGFNSADAVVYCGSSNLALMGEGVNGDNLLAIHDEDVATVFAIEALALVDHFDFLDRSSKAPQAKKTSRKKAPPAAKVQAAVEAGMFLSTDDGWTKPYFDPADLRSVDRRLFA